MKRFSYPLEAVLTHRKLLEEAEQLGFASIVRRLVREQELLESQIRHSQAIATELAQRERRKFDLRESLLYREYLKALDLIIEATQARIVGLQKELELKRIELVRATMNRKVIDTHRHREHGKYLVEIDRAEQKIVDDLSSVRHTRGAGDLRGALK